MNDELKERLSAFMDGESGQADVVDAMTRNEDLRDTWGRYHMIRDVMQQRYTRGAGDIANRVSIALADEAIVIAPKRWFQPRHMMKQVAGLAVAATVAAVAILFVQNPTTSVIQNDQIATVTPITDLPVRQTTAVERKLSGYLVSHNEVSASTRMKGVLPYTRIVSQVPGQVTNQNTGANVE